MARGNPNHNKILKTFLGARGNPKYRYDHDREAASDFSTIKYGTGLVLIT